MKYLDETINICDTPLNDIIRFISSCQCFKGVDIDLIKLKLIRQKRNLKRVRAKNRQFIPKKMMINE
jgi:hypothetical protein